MSRRKHRCRVENTDGYSLASVYFIFVVKKINKCRIQRIFKITVSYSFSYLDEVDCIFPFEFKNVTYKSCTTVENKGQAWCSLDSKYRDRWKECPSGSYIFHMHFKYLITSFWLLTHAWLNTLMLALPSIW